MEKNYNCVSIVIVLYNPSKEDINNIRNLANYYSGTIVDNSTVSHDIDSIGMMTYITNGRNLGIAQAQNIGIKHIMSQQASQYIVFIDQDSRFPIDYPKRISYEYQQLENKKIAILGPTVFNKDKNNEYKSIIHKYKTESNGFCERNHIISSGSCISIKSLQEIGLLDSNLFIDFVDFEWCWRAKAKGYKCGITDRLSIYHKVGKRELNFGKYKVIVSAPQRYFYQYRNYLWLIRRKYVPLQWKIATGIKFMLRLVYFPLCVKGGFACWREMIKGIKAGI